MHTPSRPSPLRPSSTKSTPVRRTVEGESDVEKTPSKKRPVPALSLGGRSLPGSLAGTPNRPRGAPKARRVRKTFIDGVRGMDLDSKMRVYDGVSRWSSWKSFRMGRA